MTRKPMVNDIIRGDLTAESLRSVLHYDPDSGAFTWLQTLSTKTKIGAVAGTQGGRSVIIKIDGHRYEANRLAWLYMTGSWPECEVDHENRRPRDNRWLNLRDATTTQNHANSLYPSESGVKGAYWHPKSNLWKCCITVSGKLISLGYYKTAQEANEAYLAAARKHFGEFARAQ